MRRGLRRRVLACLAGGLAAAGCAKRFQPLDVAALRASQPRSMVVALARTPAITAEGPAKEFELTYIAGTLGVLGAVAGVIGAAGRSRDASIRRSRWMKRCEIEDPVDEIRETVAESLREVVSLEERESGRRTKATAPADLVKDYPGADLIVDVRTSRWGIHNVPKASKVGEVHFASFYEGSFRLIDARRAAVIVEGNCAIQFSNDDDPPTLNELFDDDCALLRKGLKLSAQTCATLYRTRALGIDRAASD